MPASSARAARDGARAAIGRPSFTGSSMPLESGAIVGIERRKSNVGKPGPQQRDEIEARQASAMPEELAHQALGPVPPDRPSDPARRDDAQPAPVQTVRKREQNEITAVDADTLPLHAEELPPAPDPVEPGKIPIHVCAPPLCAAQTRQETERRFRPLARRRLRTSLPVFVLMRLRNPWVRLRRRLFG